MKYNNTKYQVLKLLLLQQWPGKNGTQNCIILKFR